MLHLFNLRVRAMAALLLASTALHAQTFTVTPAKGSGPFTVVWDIPNGTDCQAGGLPDWTGAVAASGTKQVSPTLGTKTLSLVCSVPGIPKKGWVTISWNPPTQRVDGTPYSDAKDVLVFASKSTPPTIQIATVPVGTNAWRADNLDAGKWYFGVKSRDQAGAISDLSAIASASVADIATMTTLTASPITIEVIAPAKPKAPVITVTVGTE